VPSAERVTEGVQLFPSRETNWLETPEVASVPWAVTVTGAIYQPFFPSAGGNIRLAEGAVLSRRTVFVAEAVFPAISWACTWTVNVPSEEIPTKDTQELPFRETPWLARPEVPSEQAAANGHWGNIPAILSIRSRQAGIRDWRGASTKTVSGALVVTIAGLVPGLELDRVAAVRVHGRASGIRPGAAIQAHLQPGQAGSGIRSGSVHFSRRDIPAGLPSRRPAEAFKSGGTESSLIWPVAVDVCSRRYPWRWQKVYRCRLQRR